MSAGPSVHLDTFKGNYAASSFLTKLTDQVLQVEGRTSPSKSSPSSKGSPAKDKRIPADPAAAVELLLSSFERAEKDLGKLQLQVDQRVQDLQQALAKEEQTFQVQIEVLEAHASDVQSSLLQMDTDIGQIGHSTRLGDRIQAAEAARKRAKNAGEVMTYLAEFASVSDFSELSELFQDDNRLAEAAAMTRQILALANEVMAAKERAGSSSTAVPSQSSRASQQGVAQAIDRLEDYRNLLEHRVVARFDSAVGSSDLGSMMACARIMAEFKRGETSLMQRYIATRAMFMDAKEVQFTEGRRAVDAAEAITAMRSLGGLYKNILAAVRDEAVVMEQVFPNPGPAMAMLIHRIFEQRIQAALDRLLVAPPLNAGPEAQQQHLKLLTEAYKRTLALSDSLQEIVREAADVQELAEESFGEHLADYPASELAWLQDLHNSTLGKVGRLAMEPVSQYCSWNAEAVERCATLSQEGSLPRHVRQLFVGPSPRQPHLGCLLDQVSAFLQAGLVGAGAQCNSTCSNPFSPATVGPVLNRSSAAKAAEKVIEIGMGSVLEAVGLASTIILAVRQHYLKVVEKRLQGSAPDAAACAAGLAGMVRATEERILTSLQVAITAFFAQVERTLTTEQKRVDFRPMAGMVLPLDQPTDACLLASSLIDALLRFASATLQATNLTSFCAEVGRKTHALLMTHMQHFSFSPAGALRWKRDVNEYTETLQVVRIQAIDEKMEELASMANMLVVAPDSLLGLVDSSMRISHRTALATIRLREDFRTAKVGSSTLAAIFSGD
ncbi:hypothetical protein WJX74_007103 [Apatococcus lobatus]|uniref:Exocyst complex component Sec10 n=1 Tax=Apatococcus lobatus TaxID=904363 RepID=A0AAW1QVR2_9CHLO